MNRCDKCGNPQVIIHKKYSGQTLCRECFIRTTREKVLRDIRKYRLIERGDKILLGLSGGKDSVMTLDILRTLHKRGVIDLTAVTIDEGIKGYREEGVRIAALNAQKMGVKHRIVSFKEYFGKTLDEMMNEVETRKSKYNGNKNGKKSDDKNVSRHACTYCGVFRRWILNQVAKEEDATKIATGHNLDDETQSILMNYLEGNINNLTRIGPKSESRSERLTVKIKPLREIPEKEVGLYTVARGLKVHFAGCPYAKDSFRAEIGDFIREISAKHPTIMYSTLRGFDRIKPALKKEFSRGQREQTMGICRICGEPAAKELCKACTFREVWR